MKRNISIFIITLLLWGTVLPFPGFAEETNLIRVGYVENYGVLKFPRIRGQEGYIHEYLNKILQYTQKNYRIEYVECTVGNVTEKLRTGEIDLFAPATITEERNEEFIFSEQDLGRELRLLIATDPEYITTGDFSVLHNSVIAVDQGDSMVDELYQFLGDNKISADVIEIEVSSFHEALKSQQYDFLLAGSMLMEQDLNIIANFYTSHAYFMAMPAQSALMNDLNQAMAQVEEHEYLFQEKLYLKYFRYNYDLTSNVTKADFELLKFKNIYKVGVTDLNSPLSYVNDEGEIDGIFREIMDLMVEDMTIHVEYVLLEGESDPDVLNQQDFNFLSLDDESRFLGVESDPLVQIPFMVLKKTEEFSHNSSQVGTLEHYGLSQEDVNFFTSGETMVEFSDTGALISAFQSGEIDSMLITTVIFNTLTAILDSNTYLATHIDYYLSPTIVFNDTFPKTKIEAFNKFITRLDPLEVEYIILEQTIPVVQEQTFQDILKNNPIIINVFFALIALIILTVFLLERSKKQALMDLLNIDSITGLLTEHCFLEKSQEVLQDNPSKKYSILSVDIDNFKYINEVYGYEKGTLILVEFAKYIQDFSMKPVVSSRCFSDNFIFLVETPHLEEELQKKINEKSGIIALCNEHLSQNYNFGYSIGLYHIENPSLGLNYMIDCANFARNLGKETLGRTCYVFSDDMKKERDTSNHVLSQTDHALNHHEFVMYYQPKIELNSTKTTGAEALVRWIREGKMVPPDDFIPLFEKNGFIEKLDYYVLEAVCTFIQANKEKKLPVISVNLSGFTVMHENLVENLMEVLEKYQVLPTEIDLEITESAFVENFQRAVSKLDTLRELGFTISMDDFGAGISSLGRLKAIPIDILKIDRQFIVDSLENDKGSKIIQNIVRMAQDIQVETVAEGIETLEQLEFLKDLGCDVGQGYYFSRPLPEKDFLNFIS